MCRSCSKDAYVAEAYWSNVLGLQSSHYGVDGETALGFDGVGDDVKLPGGDPLLIVTTDEVPDETGAGNPTLEIGGDSIISTIETIGDQDFYRVELQAGQTYEFGQYATTEGPNATPLSDAFLEIYDSEGNFLQSADGGGQTPGGETYGLDALLTFRAEEAGVYYINARAFDQAPEDGDNGDSVGDYEIFARESNYEPYYDLNTPLHAIDWGTQVDGSSRNPDGEEGPRPTGNDFIGSSNDYGIEGKNVVTYYFAQQGDVFITEDPTSPGLTDTIVASGMADWEKEAFEEAFSEFSEVADVVYVEVFTRDEADFKLITYNGTPEAGILGRMSPPDTQNEGQAEFNRNGPGWTEEELERGGFSFITLVHELGHGHGLAHPHDNGGRSSIMPGVEEESTFNYTTGDFEMNQGVHTMMSYEDGWQSSPYGNSPDDGYGYLSGPMALDIAVIQDKYGVNEDTATGDNIYVLKDVNAPGTFFDAIWDAGGEDAIVYRGNRAATINLNDATLQYEIGGGGFVSYANGIFGGYTIANSVLIENARTFNGNDRIFGNETGNVLRTGSGDDKAWGGLGHDNVRGDAGVDMLMGEEGNDKLFGQAGIDTLVGGDGNDQVSGGDANDTINGNVGNDLLIGGQGRDAMTGGGGADIFSFDDGDVNGLWNQADRVLDFSRFEGDRINLKLMDADSGTAGDQSFVFIGDSDFSNKAGELRQFEYEGKLLIAGDTDGDGIGDFFLRVDKQTEMLATDFVL